MRTKRGAWNGNQAFFSFLFNKNSFVFAIHREWRMRYVKPQGKSGTKRLYIGPFEIQWSRYKN